MNQILYIAIGGALGSLARFGLSGAVYASLGRSFPYGTLVVNVLGSLMIGFLSVLLTDKLNISPELRNAILIGFLGALTTFSTFSLETLNLMEQGMPIRALVNVLISVFACIIAAWIGLLIARQL